MALLMSEKQQAEVYLSVYLQPQQCAGKSRPTAERDGGEKKTKQYW